MTILPVLLRLSICIFYIYSRIGHYWPAAPVAQLKTHIVIYHIIIITSFFRYARIMEKDPCRGVVYLTVLRDHPYLVSLLFHSAIPTSCYIFDVLY